MLKNSKQDVNADPNGTGDTDSTDSETTAKKNLTLLFSFNIISSPHYYPEKGLNTNNEDPFGLYWGPNYYNKTTNLPDDETFSPSELSIIGKKQSEKIAKTLYLLHDKHDKDGLVDLSENSTLFVVPRIKRLYDAANLIKNNLFRLIDLIKQDTLVNNNSGKTGVKLTTDLVTKVLSNSNKASVKINKENEETKESKENNDVTNSNETDNNKETESNVTKESDKKVIKNKETEISKKETEESNTKETETLKTKDEKDSKEAKEAETKESESTTELENTEKTETKDIKANKNNIAANTNKETNNVTNKESNKVTNKKAHPKSARLIFDELHRLNLLSKVSSQLNSQESDSEQANTDKVNKLAPFNMTDFNKPLNQTKFYKESKIYYFPESLKKEGIWLTTGLEECPKQRQTFDDYLNSQEFIESYKIMFEDNINLIKKIIKNKYYELYITDKFVRYLNLTDPVLDSHWKSNKILVNFLINIMAHQYHKNNLNVNLMDLSNDGSMEEYLNGISMDNPNFDKVVFSELFFGKYTIWDMNRYDQFFVKNFSEEFMKFSFGGLFKFLLEILYSKMNHETNFKNGLKMVNIMVNDYNLAGIMKAFKVGNKNFDKEDDEVEIHKFPMVSFGDVLTLNFVKDNSVTDEYQSISIEMILNNELILKLGLVDFGDQVNKYISYKDDYDFFEDLCY